MTAPVFTAWIETGKTNGLYTLHRVLVGRPEHPMHKPFTYVRNLGRSWETACKNADKWLDANPCEHIKEYHIDEECNTLRPRGTYDDLYFWFGKYNTQLIENVIKNDLEYVLYIRDNFVSTNPRMMSLIEKLVEMDLGKSEAEIACEQRAAKKAADEAKWDAIKKPIPVELADGRSTLTGEILFTYNRDTDFGPVTKMMFLDDRGFKVNGTAPSKLWDVFGFDVELAGKRIQFDAALTISDDDESFAFYKRPTKVSEAE